MWRIDYLQAVEPDELPATDGITAAEWEPLSPVTGKLDAFEWRVPTSAVAARTTLATILPPPPPPEPVAPAEPAANPTSLALPES